MEKFSMFRAITRQIWFIENKKAINTGDLIAVIEKTQPISKSLEEKIKTLQESLKKISFKEANFVDGREQDETSQNIS